MDGRSRRGRRAEAAAQGVGITAALGPTNTGKTHRAVERMLEHRSGMIGLPLRLLAREVYERVTARIGEARVALVTGEEKRVPARPDYWVCTVESMPITREVDFVAVDEIQLCAHRQRGHVFTDRLLHARGLRETWFMGADTIRPVLEQLVPTAAVHRHPRLSQLRSLGSVSLGALPPRTAVVAFSANEVYALAERLRQRRGGAAVVLGALSPRTRNAQVALYQAGEVDYMVATDAIGMGLNMDVDTVAFASLRKFDGHELRELEAAELAQIAGRAGRAQNEGQFCTLAPLRELPAEIVDAIETHRFPALRRVVWRCSPLELDFRSVETLLESLARRPPRRVLERVRRAEDSEALAQLATRDDVRGRARGSAAVELLWEVCQIPDFRKLLFDGHVDLLAEIYRQLTGPRRRLDPDWLGERLARLDDVGGDIHTLMGRIAHTRTWTYVSNRRDWLVDAEHWQARSREIEDRLSDALHERLIARFVELEDRSAPRRPAARRGPGQGRAAKAGGGRRRGRSIDRQAVAEGPFAKLLELELEPSVAASEPESESVERWVEGLIDAPHGRFALDEAGWIVEGQQRLARLVGGVDLPRPEVALAVGEDLGAGARSRIQRRLLAWARDEVSQLLAPLRSAAAERLSSDARGLVYQLEQGLGTIHAGPARPQLQRLRGRDRQRLRGLGVELGERMIWLPQLLRAPALRLRAALCSAALPRGVRLASPASEAVALAPDPDIDPAAYTALGFPVFGPRALRADIAERMHGELRSLGRSGPFELPAQLGAQTGVTRDELSEILVAFGYRFDPSDDRWRAEGRGRGRRSRRDPGPTGTRS